MFRRHFRLLAKALLVVTVVRLLLSFRGYRSVLAVIGRVGPRPDAGLPMPLLSWAIVRTAAFVPGATCMTQALALRYLAAREGQSCTIRIGVKHEPGRPFEAHAWVVHHGMIVIGGQQERIDEFSPIVDL